MKKIAILGSTGSIGTQTLNIIEQDNELELVAISANSNIDLLEQQILKFSPKKACVMQEEKALELKKRMSNHNTELLSGMSGLIEIATLDEVDIVVTAVVGMIGIKPTIEAVKCKKDIALANKETLVTAGNIIMPLAQKLGVSIIPVDSEHSAIFQCINGEKQQHVNKIILTASGGPFRGKKAKDLEKISVEDALKHPNWSMGNKISIDSATLMNKGLEVIEAKWLFDVSYDQIDVYVHPQSIVHSMVEFIDGSILAQMGNPDMRLPIQYAIHYPNRKNNILPKTTIKAMKQLTFELPDTQTFKGLNLAYEALKIGGTMPTVLNAANEYAVQQFLNKKIGFTEIYTTVEYAMLKHDTIFTPLLEDILETEQWTYRILESR